MIRPILYHKMTHEIKEVAVINFVLDTVITMDNQIVSTLNKEYLLKYPIGLFDTYGEEIYLNDVICITIHGEEIISRVILHHGQVVENTYHLPIHTLKLDHITIQKYT